MAFRQAKVRKIAAYSRPEVLSKLDGRTREARVMQRVKADLVQHVGGKPSPTQSALIERAAWLTLHIALMDARISELGEQPSERDGRQYLAWSNTLTRTLLAIGTKAKNEERPATLRDHLAARAAHAA